LSKWILLVVLLAIAVAAAIFSNPDWRGKMADPGGLIGSIQPRKEVHTASTKQPNSSKSDSGSRVELPSPTISIGDDAGGHSAGVGSQALGGTLGPSPSATTGVPTSVDTPRPTHVSGGRTGPTSTPSPVGPRPSPGAAAAPPSQEIAAQIGAILKSRETSRGLITMLPNALFEPGSALLGAAGNDKLSRIANLILAQPGIKVEVDSYTGQAEVFQSGLSAGRAASVRLFLIAQGVNERDLTQRNINVPPTETAAGAELSRDVALVISGSSH